MVVAKARNPVVSFHGYRIACSHAKKGELRQFLAKQHPRAWTDAAIKKIVAHARDMDWGVMDHGGARRGEKYAAKRGEGKCVVIQPMYRHRQKKPLKQARGGGSDLVAVGTGVSAAATDLVAVGTGVSAAATDLVALGTGVPAEASHASSIIVQKVSGSAPPEKSCTFGFEVLQKIGQGVFGQVFKARGANGDLVAIKHMACKPGAMLTTMQGREVATLKKLQGQPNVIKLLEVNKTCFGVDLVFELAEQTLRECIQMHKQADAPIDKVEVVCYTKHLFNGLKALHQNNVIHRDIKPSNLLIARGVLLISDFGWARELPSAIGDEAQLERNVYTLWWRPPEILLGAATYGFSADVWAAGCVCVEMCEGKPAFAGESEAGTLQLQLRKLGTPTKQEWPGMFSLPRARNLQYYPTRPWSTWGTRIGSQYIRLLQGVLTIAPIRRSTASETWTFSKGIMETI